jgi:hypothetical protein
MEEEGRMLCASFKTAYGDNETDTKDVRKLGKELRDVMAKEM